VTKGVVNAERSSSGLGVVEGHEAELIIGMKEVGSEGKHPNLCLRERECPELTRANKKS
jgi:hypothetical protein